jgi:hypothetical protein
MGADTLAENTPNVQFVCPIPKVLDFNEKRLHWESVFASHTYSIYAKRDSSLLSNAKNTSIVKRKKR